MSDRQKLWLWLAAGLAWLGLAGVAILIVIDYQTPPPIAGAGLDHWPSQSTVPRAEGRATLVALVHPRCPCSRATLGELERILSRAPDRVTTHLLFWKPHGADPSWEKAPLWSDAAAHAWIQAHWDEGGREARLFQASASGYALLYDERGRLLFRGGLTGGHGNCGGHASSDAIVSALLHRSAPLPTAAAFGCPLLAEKNP
jgi:hypothetical protein